MSNGKGTIYIKRKRKLMARKGQQWQYRWFLEGKNGRQMATSGGDGYWNKDDLMHTLHILFGPRLNGHRLIDYSDVTPPA